MSVGGASGLLSYFVINKDLGSAHIQDILNQSTANLVATFFKEYK